MAGSLHKNCIVCGKGFTTYPSLARVKTCSRVCGHVSGKRTRRDMPEIGRKISETMKGRMPKNIGQIAGWNRGKGAPWAVGNKHGLGRVPWNKGVKGVVVGYWRDKKRPEMMGSRHPMWKGGFDKKAYAKAYRAENKYSIYHRNMRRRSLRFQAEGSHTLQEWENLKAQFDNTCFGCREKKYLTRDHIVPLSKGGSDYIWNIQPLCKSCNSKKHDKIVRFHEPTYAILKTKTPCNF